MRFLFKIRQLQSPLASILLVLIFLSAGFFHYIFYNMEIDYHNSKLKEADEMEANAIWDVVESTIVSSNYIAEHSAIHAANNITKDINAKYDVKILKQQLDGSALEESEVVSLLYENIKENHLYKIDNNRNTLFILTNNGNIIFLVMANEDWANIVLNGFKKYVNNDIGKVLEKNSSEKIDFPDAAN